MRAAGIPGFNRAKAQAVVDYHAGGTISEIMGSTIGELARIPLGRMTLGVPLAQALTFVIE